MSYRKTNIQVLLIFALVSVTKIKFVYNYSTEQGRRIAWKSTWFDRAKNGIWRGLEAGTGRRSTKQTAADD